MTDLRAKPTLQAGPTPTSGPPPVSRLRHRSELPMLVVAGAASAAAIALVLALAILGIDEPSWLVSAVVAAAVAPVLTALVIMRLTYWTTISNGVEVTSDQLPRLHEMFQDLGAQLGMSPEGEGMAKLPRLYVVNGNGTMNAYATKCRIRRGYVVIYSDLLDVAYLNGDFDTVRFILGHELGHIHCGHVSVWRAVLRPVSMLLQLGQSVSRAQEYTADRVGCYLAPDGALGMVSVLAGKHVGTHVDVDAYFASVRDHEDGFWLKVANFRSDHAVGFRRMTALREATREGWDVQGRML
ncbi:M48 family metallopeptidase [Nocardioides sp. AX2bis]|uniref:M48 family metallopeptidase n=1 Tax=Nocardioides sp. AX2bis TaxID=2653157 RepID=UPI0012F01279|nr:M48 family metallopeptidase [Nocardioides sp. AX2bis]VXC47306.1 M48 family peptidase [Nocardioides sp. AX2bis]